MLKVTSSTTEISWCPEQRVADVRYMPGTTLKSADGDFLVEALSQWVGQSDEPFGVFADAAGLEGTDAQYRAKASGFFRQHRGAASIALVNLGPVIRVLVELFRVGTAVQLKTFSTEVTARSWLRTNSLRT